MAAPFPFDLTDRCVKCGLCLPHCPTYRLSQNESEGPRGRIAIMEGVAASLIQQTQGADNHLDNCLGCGRCETVCPAHVEYMEIRDHYRSAHHKAITYWRAHALSLPRRRIYVALLRVARIVARFIPQRLLPPAARPYHTALINAKIPMEHRRRAEPPRSSADAVLFKGCLSTALDLRAFNAAAEVLAQLENPVLPAPHSGCCGALAQHEGHLKLANQQRRKLEDSAQNTQVTIDSGCISDLRRSGLDVVELCQYLLEHWPQQWHMNPNWHGADTPLMVALHLPCTHHNGVGNTEAVITMLERVPSVNIHRIQGFGCCGAGGTHMLDQPAHAESFAKRLLAELPSHTDVLLSTNIGCRTHLRTHAPNLEIRHPVELLRDALSITPPDTLI